MAVLFGDEPIKVSEEIQQTKQKSDLWELMTMMFTNPQKFAKVSTYEKSKHIFMMHRSFAIKYPIQAAMLSTLKINAGEVVQYWSDNLSKIYNKTPAWIFNGFKNVKKTKVVEKNKFDVKDETLQYYCEKNQCSRRELNEVLEYCGEKFVNRLKELEKNLDS